MKTKYVETRIDYIAGEGSQQDVFSLNGKWYVYNKDDLDLHAKVFQSKEEALKYAFNDDEVPQTPLESRENVAKKKLIGGISFGIIGLVFIILLSYGLYKSEKGAASTPYAPFADSEYSSVADETIGFVPATEYISGDFFDIKAYLDANGCEYDAPTDRLKINYQIYVNDDTWEIRPGNYIELWYRKNIPEEEKK